jgi:hypothetical protein
MDEAKLETVMPEVKARLAQLSRVSGSKALAIEVARLKRSGAEAFFEYGRSSTRRSPPTSSVPCARAGSASLTVTTT